MIEPKVIWSGEIEPEQLSVSIADSSNRAIDPRVESRLQDAWASKLVEAGESGATMYDGVSYRLESFSTTDDHIHLEVSPFQFSVRSTLKRMPELESLGEAYYSHGLNVGGFVQTSDGQYIFGRKSSKSASSLKTDIIGGVLEKIEPLNGEGILNMNRTELHEELNVTSYMIESIRIVGLLRLSSTDINIITSTKLKVTANELMRIFEMREDMELEAIDFVAPENLETYLQELGGYKPMMLELLNNR